MRWGRARLTVGEGPCGRGVRYLTLVEEYQALAPPHRRALQHLGPWPHGTGPARRSPSVTALRQTVERERQQAMGELASTAAHEMNNVLHAMALRLASLHEQHTRGELAGGVEALARMVAEAAEMVRRLQDRAGKSRSEAQFTLTPAPGTQLARRRVLVVDDDEDVLEAAALALEHLGQQVDLAPSGVEAVARVMAGERYDLVLCDLGMPELDGWQVAREIAGLAPGTRLYVVSGWAREVAPEQATQLGVAGMLAKPLSIEALRALLAATPAATAGGGRSAPASERSEEARAPGGVVRDPAPPQLEAHDPAPR